MRFGNAARSVLTVGLLGLALGKGAWAQISLTNASASYTQTFDSLSATGSTGTTFALNSNQTIKGLYSNLSTYMVSRGSNSTASLYSFGSASGDTERALGSIAGSNTGTIYYGFRFVNDGSTAINGFTLSYNGEQYRDGGNTNNAAQSLTFDYSVFSSGTTGSITTGNYTRVASLDFTSPIHSSTPTVLDGNATANKMAETGMVSNLTINKGDEVWIRWTDINDTSGNGNNHGLAIDDINFSASFVTPTDTPEPASLVLLGGAGLPLGAFWMRSRKRK